MQDCFHLVIWLGLSEVKIRKGGNVFRAHEMDARSHDCFDKPDIWASKTSPEWASIASSLLKHWHH
jgi:hypothetical protein